MLKVFISQPMRGRDSDEIDRERKSLLQYVRDIVGPCDEIPSHFDEKAVAKMPPLDCLGNSIKLLAYADLAVFAPGWSEARGCRIEHMCAQEYGVKVIEMP